MIIHGHGGKTFAQYSNELWPNDSNFTIGLFLHLFHSLEKEPIRESQVLFKFIPQNACFQQLLEGSSHCLNALKYANKIVGVKPLLRKLFFQVDNCVKDNKNVTCWHFFLVNCSWSLRRSLIGVSCSWAHTWKYWQNFWIFVEEIERAETLYVMVDLMKTFMHSQDRPFILQLI